MTIGMIGDVEDPEGVSEFSRGAWGGAAVICLLISIFFSQRIIVERPSWDTGGNGQEMPGLLAAISQRPSFSFGFQNFMADVAWLQAVQVSGNLKMAPADYDRFHELLNVVANYDPRFEIPYLIGGLVLGESPLHLREALLVLERGKTHHPDKWRFPYYIGFTHYFSLGDVESAGKAMADAARMPGSPPYLAGLASRMLSEARKPDTAIALLVTIARQENDPGRRAVLERRIREIIVERDLQALERAVEKYREKTGIVPEKLADLVREGVLAAIPAEPNGGRYLLESGGKVRSDRVAQRLRVFRQQ